MTAIDEIHKEQKRLETNVRRALLVVGFRRVIQLCADHADACYMEATDTTSKARWRTMWRILDHALTELQK